MGVEDPWPPKPGRSRLLQPVIQIGAASMMIVGGIRTAALGSTAMGIVLLAAGGITAALAMRGLIHRLRSPDSDRDVRGASKDQFDYSSDGPWLPDRALLSPCSRLMSR
jgi:hypothetical protein